MKIGILDSKYLDAGSWLTIIKRVAEGAGIQRWVFDNPSPNLETFLGSDANVPSFCLILHCSNQMDWDAAQEDGSLKVVLVHVGTHGSAHATFKPWKGRRFICGFTAQEFEATNGCAFLKSVVEGSPDWSLLSAALNEHLWAMRLLCEAWLLQNWALGNDYNRVNDLKRELGLGESLPSLPTGFPIHASKTRDDWLMPFSQMSPKTLAEKMPDGVSKKAIMTFFDNLTHQPSFSDVADLFFTLAKALNLEE